MLNDNCLTHAHRHVIVKIYLMDLGELVFEVKNDHFQIFSEPAFSISACDVHFHIRIFCNSPT